MDPFEQSADMRLLELRRKALGKEARPPSNWSAASTDMHDGIPAEELAPPTLTGSRLLVDLTANPKAKLVAGAVVTLSLAVQNAGDRIAEGVRVSVPVPGDSTFREGSLIVDGRAASGSYADAFLGEGFLIDKVQPGQRVGFIWKISVESGTSSLVVAPRVSSKNSAVVGSASLLLSRGATQRNAALPEKYVPAQPEAERPFYELDASEEHSFAQEVETGDARQGRDAPLFMMPDIVVEPPAEPVAAALSVPINPPEPEPAEPLAELAEPRLYSSFDSATLTIVKRLFASESFGQVPHYILQNALACSISATGRDVGVRAHVSQQASLLSRAILMRKLNKTMHVGDFASGKLDFDLAAANEPSAEAPQSSLYMQLTQAEIDFCSPVKKGNPLESFIRIRQLAVALQARRIITEDQALKARGEAALEAYATSARAAINRTFIRAKLDPKYDPFGAVDAKADELAHELIEVLSRVFGA